MTTLHNVAWFGTGQNGLPALNAVAASGRFRLTLLLRESPSGPRKAIPSTVHTVVVDFARPSTLVDVLRGQDAVVVFTKLGPGSDMDKLQIALIDAAITAGVKLFIPSEWAPDTAGGNAATPSLIGPATLPPNGVIGQKRAAHNYLFARAAEGLIDYSLLFTGVMLAPCINIGMIHFDFDRKLARLPDGGIHPFSTTSIRTLCTAVIGLLSEYPKTRNRLLYIADGISTQRELVAVVERVRKETWTKESFSIVENKARTETKMRDGIYGSEQVVDYLRLPFFGGLTVWKRLDNELLGIRDGDRIDPREEIARIAAAVPTGL